MGCGWRLRSREYACACAAARPSPHLSLAGQARGERPARTGRRPRAPATLRPCSLAARRPHRQAGGGYQPAAACRNGPPRPRRRMPTHAARCCGPPHCCLLGLEAATRSPRRLHHYPARAPSRPSRHAAEPRHIVGLCTAGRTVSLPAAGRIAAAPPLLPVGHGRCVCGGGGRIEMVRWSSSGREEWGVR